MASSSLVHVAVEKRDLERAVRCAPSVLQRLLPLLAKLGTAKDHPNWLTPCAIDSIGYYLDEEAQTEARRAELVNGSVRVEYKTRRFDVMQVQVADTLPSVQRRQCVAIQGTNEVARRLDASERGAAEILVTFQCGATLSVRQNKRAERMVVLCTSAQKKKKVLDATLEAEDVPKLAELFALAAQGSGGGASSSSNGWVRRAVPASARSQHFKLDGGAYWQLPAWYAEACAVVAQDVFRLHALVSATSQNISRALFVDRVTAHRIDGGSLETHRTLIKTVFHRASGGCACGLHRLMTPAQPFKHLVMRMEFCGCPLDAQGRCKRHYRAERKTESAAFPGVCMVNFQMHFHCEHEERAGIRIPLKTDDARMDLRFAHRFLVDLGACGARLMAEGAHGELEVDVGQMLQELENQRIAHNHLGDAMLQRDVSAVYLLRTGSTVTKKTGKFAGRVRADCNAILKTHKHLFRPV